MKHLKTFESYNSQFINENLFSDIYKSLMNLGPTTIDNENIKKGMQMVSDFFKKNPQKLEELKSNSANEISKFSEQEIQQFGNSLTKFKDPVRDEELKDAVGKVISEVSESTVVKNAIKYLAQKFLDFLGVSLKWIGLIMLVGQVFVGAATMDLYPNGGIFNNPLLYLGMIIGGILLIFTGVKITNHTQGKYDAKTGTTSPGSLDQFSGEHKMKYYN